MWTKYSKQCTEKFSKQVNLQGGQEPLVSPLVVTLLHCRFVFGELLPQSLSCFADVHMISLSTRYFKTTSCIVQGWAASLSLKLLPSCPYNHKSLRGRQTQSIFSLAPAMHGRNNSLGAGDSSDVWQEQQLWSSSFHHCSTSGVHSGGSPW